MKTGIISQNNFFYYFTFLNKEAFLLGLN